MSLTKKDKVKAHLLSGKPITPLEALRDYGSFRLADIVFRLKKEGMNIISEPCTIGGSTFAKYSLFVSSE